MGLALKSGLIASKISLRPRGFQREFQTWKLAWAQSVRVTQRGTSKRSGRLQLGAGGTVDTEHRDTQ